MNQKAHPQAQELARTRSPLLAVMLQCSTSLSFLEQLADYHCVEPDVRSLAETPFDLAIFDLDTLEQWEGAIRELRCQSPALQLPFLLVVSDQELARAARFLGDLVDDLLRIPLSTLELHTRIGSLLRLHRLATRKPAENPTSATPHARSNQTLDAFVACNDRMISACREQDILLAVCTSLTREGGFPLAWVGKRDHSHQDSGQMQDRVRPMVVAGTAEGCLPQILEQFGPGVLSQRPLLHTFEHGVCAMETHSPQTTAGQTDTSSLLHSVLVVPLGLPDGRIENCLAVYTSVANGFGEQQIELLQQMADNAVHAIGALREKFRRLRSERETHRLAFRDHLTGLANRAAMIQTLDQHLQQFGPNYPATGLLYIDIDGFKLVNDALGHVAGDQVLVEVGRRLQAAVRTTDLVARHGSDEFIVFAPHCSDFGIEQELTAELTDLAEQLTDALTRPMTIQGRDYHIEASIGISLCPQHATSALQLLMSADNAMYEAKKLSGNSYQFFSCDLSERNHERLDLEGRLYQAIQQDSFQLAFQPIVDLRDGTVTGAEALLRWPQSDGSFISPAEFIPIAEKSGLILHIGDWVMTQALATLHRLRQQGFKQIQIAVNLAIAQLWQSHLVDSVVAQLEKLAIPPNALKVELTEGSLMTDVERMEEVVKEFRGAGIQVAIDDFGTGYSSLARLRSLPVTTLKIDRSFLMDAPGDLNAVKLVNGISQMAGSLDLESVAEGIETAEQWHMLQELGCDYGQGYHFAKPMPETDFIALLQGH